MEKFKAAIVLSGCGVFDGTEIHEAVITLLNLQKLGAKTAFFAPDKPQAHVVNHLAMTPEPQARGVLEESARIARGEISPLSKFDEKDFDMLLFPGGFGAAKNLSDFAFKGAQMSVDADAERAIRAMVKEGKPVGFICIAPVIAAKVLGGGAKLTIGKDPSTAAAINALGAEHVECPAESFVEDKKFNVFSTPAYMLAENATQIDAGVGAMVAAMAESIKK